MCKGRTIILFKEPNNEIPAYITNDKNSIILQKQLQGYD
jgi:hypothetical protein